MQFLLYIAAYLISGAICKPQLIVEDAKSVRLAGEFVDFSFANVDSSSSDEFPDKYTVVLYKNRAIWFSKSVNTAEKSGSPTDGSIEIPSDAATGSYFLYAYTTNPNGRGKKSIGGSGTKKFKVLATGNLKKRYNFISEVTKCGSSSIYVSLKNSPKSKRIIVNFIDPNGKSVAYSANENSFDFTKDEIKVATPESGAEGKFVEIVYKGFFGKKHVIYRSARFDSLAENEKCISSNDSDSTADDESTPEVNDEEGEGFNEEEQEENASDEGENDDEDIQSDLTPAAIASEGAEELKDQKEEALEASKEKLVNLGLDVDDDEYVHVKLTTPLFKPETVLKPTQKRDNAKFQAKYGSLAPVIPAQLPVRKSEAEKAEDRLKVVAIKAAKREQLKQLSVDLEQVKSIIIEKAQLKKAIMTSNAEFTKYAASRPYDQTLQNNAIVIKANNKAEYAGLEKEIKALNTQIQKLQKEINSLRNSL